MDKRKLSETDIISKFILPAVKTAGWDDITQIRQEVKLRDGKVIVRGQLGVRKTVKSADIVLYHKPSMPLAVIEAKANKHEVGKGLQQGLDYARLLDVPFIFASNGDGFIFHDKTKLGTPDANNLETEIRLEDFPSPQELWAEYCADKGYTESQLPIINQAYYDDGSGKHPRYYQLQAIDKTVEDILSVKYRPDNVQKRNYFTKYSGTGHIVIESFSFKYTDVSVQEIEFMLALKVVPFNKIGSQSEIVNKGIPGKQGYKLALVELQQELYKVLGC